MGRQVRFCALEKDVLKLIEFEFSINAALVYGYTKELPVPLIEYPEVALRRGSFRGKLYFWKKSLLFEEDDISKLKLEKFSPNYREFADENGNFYSIDETNAPVIEFDPGFINPAGILIQGRIWANFLRLETTCLVAKSDEFKNWYEESAKWIRKNFKKIKGFDGYFGPDAYQWFINGGKVEIGLMQFSFSEDK